MNKRLLILVLLSLFLLTSCGSNKKDSEYYISHIETDLNIEIQDNATIEYEDTHGGFHGDGELFAKVVFPKDKNGATAGICQSNGYWRSLPVPMEISLRIWGGDYNGMHYDYGDERIKPAQDVVNGIYFFKDRCTESDPNNPNKGRPFLERSSYNFTFAIYDFKQHILYFYKYDS